MLHLVDVWLLNHGRKQHDREATTFEASLSLFREKWLRAVAALHFTTGVPVCKSCTRQEIASRSAAFCWSEMALLFTGEVKRKRTPAALSVIAERLAQEPILVPFVGRRRFKIAGNASACRRRSVRWVLLVGKLQMIPTAAILSSSLLESSSKFTRALMYVDHRWSARSSPAPSLVKHFKSWRVWRRTLSAVNSQRGRMSWMAPPSRNLFRTSVAFGMLDMPRNARSRCPWVTGPARLTTDNNWKSVSFELRILPYMSSSAVVAIARFASVAAALSFKLAVTEVSENKSCRRGDITPVKQDFAVGRRGW